MEGCYQMEINGKPCSCVEFPTTKTKILLICGEKGLVSCGYLNMNVASKIQEAVAMVRGAQSLEELLSAEVRSVSPVAEEMGVKPGMTGKEAMEILA